MMPDKTTHTIKDWLTWAEEYAYEDAEYHTIRCLKEAQKIAKKSNKKITLEIKRIKKILKEKKTIKHD